MKTAIPIHPVPSSPAAQGCAVNPIDGPWDLLIDASEAGETFSKETAYHHARIYDAHDRITVGLGNSARHHPSTVSPAALHSWILDVARDEYDAMDLHSALENLLVCAVRLGLRADDPTQWIPCPWATSADTNGECTNEAPITQEPLIKGSERSLELNASEVMALTEATFGPRNGWSVLTQGLVLGDWYQSLTPDTQAAFILRCKNIAVAFNEDSGFWPSTINPDDITDWIDEQTKTDSVAAGYYVAFSRLLRSINPTDWRLSALSPSLETLWSDGDSDVGDDSEMA